MLSNVKRHLFYLLKRQNERKEQAEEQISRSPVLLSNGDNDQEFQLGLPRRLLRSRHQGHFLLLFQKHCTLWMRNIAPASQTSAPIRDVIVASGSLDRCATNLAHIHVQNINVKTDTLIYVFNTEC